MVSFSLLLSGLFTFLPEGVVVVCWNFAWAPKSKILGLTPKKCRDPALPFNRNFQMMDMKVFIPAQPRFYLVLGSWQVLYFRSLFSSKITPVLYMFLKKYAHIWSLLNIITHLIIITNFEYSLNWRGPSAPCAQCLCCSLIVCWLDVLVMFWII